MSDLCRGSKESLMRAIEECAKYCSRKGFTLVELITTRKALTILSTSKDYTVAVTVMNKPVKLVLGE